VANPQVEDGHTKIANEIMDALCRIRIPGEERQILDCIFRKTYGWKKTEDAIALSQFVEMTGMNKPHIIQAIKGLLLKKVIIVTEKGNAPAKVYGINKDYDKWEPLPKKVTLLKKVMSVTEKGNPSLPKKVPTKATTTKATTTKAIKDIVGQVICHLNERTGKNFSPLARPTISHISARISEGHSLDDFKRVIDRKARDWLTDPKMSPYLRPETLFGMKFEGYLNENDHPMTGIVSTNTIKTIEALKNWSPPT